MKDLNKVSDHELAVAKRKMDMAFEERRLRPGDPGFVYDKKVDFQPTASDAGSWESEEDDSEGGEDGEKEGEDEGEAAMNTATGAATERTAAAWEEGVQEIGEGHEERAGVDTGDSDRAGEVPGAKERGEAMGELSAGSEASVELDESVDDASSFSSVGVDRKEAEVGAGDTGTAVGVAGVEGLGGGGGGFNDDMAIRGGADELDELDELDDYGEDFDDADDVLDLPGLGDGGEGIRDDIDELDELPELPGEGERRGEGSSDVHVRRDWTEVGA